MTVRELIDELFDSILQDPEILTYGIKIEDGAIRGLFEVRYDKEHKEISL